MEKAEVKLVLSVDGSRRSSLSSAGIKRNAQLQKNPITETYELSKAFKHLGGSLSGLGSVRLSNLASTGETIAHTAGGLKHLMSGIKTLGSVSVRALGAAGTAGLIAG